MERLNSFALILPDGGEVSVKCYTIRKRTHCEQHAEARGVHAVAKYGNRPWESFEYETALTKWVRAYAPEGPARDFLMEQIRAISEGVRKEADEWLKDFKARWDKVDPDLKKRTAKVLNETGHVVGSEEEGEAILKMAEAFTAMKKLGV